MQYLNKNLTTFQIIARVFEAIALAAVSSILSAVVITGNSGAGGIAFLSSIFLLKFVHNILIISILGALLFFGILISTFKSKWIWIVTTIVLLLLLFVFLFKQ